MDAALQVWFDRIASGKYTGHEEFEVNFLDMSQSSKWTADFSFHPVARLFDGIVLDDPNTSDHHLYLSQGPLRGSVFFLAHDDDSRIVFSTLDALLAAADEALATQQPLRDLHPACSPLATDQAGLGALVRTLVESGEDDDVNVALTLIPSLDLTDMPLLERIAADRDFFLVEALATAIAKRPAPALRPIAERCAAHAHSQAARAGGRALAAIDAAAGGPQA